MMKHIFIFILLAPLTTLAAGLKAKDCQFMNWEQKGKMDGLNGNKIDLLYSYTKTCDKAGAPFSADLYRKGREEGLYTYCSNRNAYDLGAQKAHVHKDVCAFNMFPDFQTYYDKGLNFKKFEKQKIAVDKKIANLSKTIEILNAAKAESEKLAFVMKDLEFKPEMANTQIHKSTLMDSMSQSISADPPQDSFTNSNKPLDLESYPGDLVEPRQPSNDKNKSN